MQLRRSVLEGPIVEFIHTVDEIEGLTAIDFFHQLPDSLEDAAEAKGTTENPVNPAWSPGRELRPVFAGAERTFNIRECD